MARSADRLRAGAGAAGEGAPQSGLVTGSATALEKERRARRNLTAAMMEGKGREGKREDEVGGWTLLLAAAWTLQKTGDQNKGPTAKLAPGLRCPPLSQGMRSDR